jgi:hypothetical protein
MLDQIEFDTPLRGWHFYGLRTRVIRPTLAPGEDETQKVVELIEEIASSPNPFKVTRVFSSDEAEGYAERGPHSVLGWLWDAGLARNGDAAKAQFPELYSMNRPKATRK